MIPDEFPNVTGPSEKFPSAPFLEELEYAPDLLLEDQSTFMQTEVFWIQLEEPFHCGNQSRKLVVSKQKLLHRQLHHILPVRVLSMQRGTEILSEEHFVLRKGFSLVRALEVLVEETDRNVEIETQFRVADHSSQKSAQDNEGSFFFVSYNVLHRPEFHQEAYVLTIVLGHFESHVIPVAAVDSIEVLSRRNVVFNDQVGEDDQDFPHEQVPEVG